MSIYVNTVISSASRSIFKLNDDDLFILSEFGKIGESKRTKINIGTIKQRQISRKCDVLQKLGFLYVVESKPYRNQPHKEIKTFSLSFKGMLASFAIKQSNIENNYYFKKYVSLFPKNLQNSVKKFMSLYIAEFLLYHQSIGLEIINIQNLLKYIKDIIYDYDLILNEVDKDKLKKIHDDMIIIDDIRDLITDIKTYDGDEPDEYYFSHSGLDDFEESVIEEMFEDDESHPTKEHIKIEFLINFWPYVIDELGRGTDVESELENISNDVPPFGLSDYEEKFTDFANQKRSIIMEQWSLRKLNFIKDYSLLF